MLWISRWFDKIIRRRIVERLLEASVRPLFVACALVSPSTSIATSIAMANSQTAFQCCYPPPREVFIIGVDPRGGVVTPPVKVS